MNRKTLLSLLVVILVASFISACSSSKKAPLVISVQLAPPPPGSLEVSYSTQLGAQVVNDTAAAGVDWTVTCTSADCGSISPAHTASGGATTYTAPATVPTGVTVTITASSTTDATANASAPITINPVGSLASLTGQYAFFVNGLDTNGPYVAAGSITADGLGNVSGGEEDYVDPLFQDLGASILGTYTIGADGRGTITLNVSGFGTQTFSVAVTSASHAQIIEFDTFATSSGTLDLQDATAFAGSIPAETIVFTTNGVDAVSAFTTVGGVLTADGAGNLTGTVDQNEGGVFSPGLGAAGPYSAVDGNGRGTFNLGGHFFAFYMIGPEVFRVVENDGSILFIGGSMFGAAPTPAAGFDVTAVTGSFVFNDNAQGTLGPVGVAGQFTADGAGNLAGFADANEGGVLSSGAVTGTYTVPDSTMPRVLATITPAAASAFTTDVSNFVVYLTDPALNLLDPNNAIVGAGSILMEADATSGVGYSIEQSPATFQGNLAVNLQFDQLTSFEADEEGQGFSDGASTITGTTDLDSAFTLNPGLATTLTFTADAANPGRFTGTIDFGAGPGDLVYYQASSTQIVYIFADPSFVDTAVGYLVHQ
jgi:hypothetical protein